jgi:hypothetical protein
MLEAHEEELSEAIRSAQQADLARFLCVERAAACEPALLLPDVAEERAASAAVRIPPPPDVARSPTLVAALADFMRLLATASSASERATSLAAVKVALQAATLARFAERDSAYLLALLRKARDVGSTAPLTTEQLHLREVRTGGFGRVVEVGREAQLARHEHLLRWVVAGAHTAPSGAEARAEL